MKTSNKLILASVIISLIYQFVFDKALQAEYLKRKYKSQFYKMQPVNLGAFKNIQNNCADVVDVRIEKGPKYSVWYDKDYSDIHITKQGETIHIDYTSKDTSEHTIYGKGIIITCPQINNIATKQVYNHSVKDGKYYYPGVMTHIVNFEQDSLTLQQGSFTEVDMNNNKLKTLNATVSKAGMNAARLTINSDNTVALARINVLGSASELLLWNPNIQKLEPTVSKDCYITASGSNIVSIKK